MISFKIGLSEHRLATSINATLKHIELQNQTEQDITTINQNCWADKKLNFVLTNALQDLRFSHIWVGIRHGGASKRPDYQNFIRHEDWDIVQNQVCIPIAPPAILKLELGMTKSIFRENEQDLIFKRKHTIDRMVHTGRSETVDYQNHFTSQDTSSCDVPHDQFYLAIATISWN